MAGMSTSFILCIDIEPHSHREVAGSVTEWGGFFTCIDYLEEWCRRLRERTGRTARFCWLLRFDQQIADSYGSPDWTVERFREPIQALQAQGDAFGVHFHPYQLGEDGRWRHDFADPAITRDGILFSRDAFVRTMGYAPESCSLGAGYLDAAAVAAMDEAGFRYDLTLTPGRSHVTDSRDLGRHDDYTRAPMYPYRPSRR